MLAYMISDKAPPCYEPNDEVTLRRFLLPSAVYKVFVKSLSAGYNGLYIYTDAQAQPATRTAPTYLGFANLQLSIFTTMPRQSTTTPKRLIVCCDGTWMASDHASKDDSSYQTNITRMCHALADDGVRDGKLVPQIVYYQDGVGTSGPDFLKVLAGARIFSINGEVITGDTGGLGWGVDHNILAAYNFLVNNYAPDDEIYLFGFSRGSFTCRSLAGLISEFGILKQSESGKYFARIWERYRGIVSDEGRRELKERKMVSHDVPIKVMGCWDTVGSLGIPEGWFTKLFGLSNKYAFHNTDISDSTSFPIILFTSH